MRIRLKNGGISRRKSEAFQGLPSESILACGKVEKEGNQGVTGGMGAAGAWRAPMTLVTSLVTIYVSI